MSVPQNVGPDAISQRGGPGGGEDVLSRATLRRAGWRLIPLLSVCYVVASMDRANVSYAALQMNRDLHFNASVYGFGAGVFFISYAACELPSNYLLLRFGARRWLARIMLTWGLLAASMMFVRSPASFYTLRFLLGMAEAGFFPGVIYYLSIWFPQDMRSRAISRFYIAYPLSNVVMGLVAGSLLSLNGRLGLKGWQWLFFIEALPAIGLAAVIFFVLPDGPETALWMRPEERAWLLRRLRKDAQQMQARAENVRLPQRRTDAGGTSGRADERTLVAVLRDARVALIGLFYFCTLGSFYAFSFSAPAIFLSVTGGSTNQAGLLIAGIALLGALAMLLVSQYSDRTQKKILPVVLSSLLMAVGFAVSGRAHSALVALPSLALATVSFYAMQGPALSLITTFLEGPSAALGIAAINTLAIFGGFVGPNWMGWSIARSGDYRWGMSLLCLPCAAGAGLILMLRARSVSEKPDGGAGAVVDGAVVCVSPGPAPSL